MIADSGQIGLYYINALLRDVTPEQFARFARCGDTVVESNHPAFIFGHLSLYAWEVIEGVGGDASAYKPSAEFVKLFSKNAKCVDDPNGDIYPPMDEVMATFTSGYDAALAALPTADDAVFMKPNPNDAMRERLPTLGAMLNFYIGGHVTLHAGQMSAWRRVYGLGPV
ncbi:MAG: DinB family protein [Novipirellula sp. JB048]